MEYNTLDRTHWRRRVRRCLSVATVMALIVPLAIIHRIAFAVDRILFPKLRHVRIERPLFVVGPPRSGTTLLHRLLADNREQFTTFPLWELVLAPALSEKFALRALARLDRRCGAPLIRCVQFVERRFTQSLNGVHQTSLWLPEEDYLGLIPFNGCFLAVLLFPHSRWVWRLGNFSHALSESRQRLLINRYQDLLRRHLYFRGQHRVLLSKNPAFCSWLPRLCEAFPDARFVGIVRSPAEVVPSQLSSIRSGLQFFGNDPTDPIIRDHFLRLLAEYYGFVNRVLGPLPEERGAIIEYQDLKASSAAVVIDCQQRFGYACSIAYRQRLNRQSTAVQQYRSGHRYRLEDFGLVRGDLDVLFPKPHGGRLRTESESKILHA
jgi:hypothetical protein